MDILQQSPFHSGEQAIQTRLGVREKLERFGQKVIRDHMPEQHREFFKRLPYLFVGHADEEGWPWASILFGDAGFIDSPDPNALAIAALPVEGDPLSNSLAEGTALGLLGIELHTRRRNRLAAHIVNSDDAGLHIHVDQAFGNCPKYIVPRESRARPSIADTTQIARQLPELDEQAISLIRDSDTFFVSSYVAEGTGKPSDGVDVSHRGGERGFVRVNGTRSLTIPDYQGNNHFNTLGNFLQNPKAGLLFVDFEQGHLLMLTGRVEILWDSPDTASFAGAQRLWTFELDHGIWLENAVPLEWGAHT